MPHNRELNFGKLPLVEVAVRATLGAYTTLTYRIVNAVGADLRSEFPDLREPTQLEVAPGVSEFQAELSLALLPGAVYSGNKLGLSISLQRRVVVVRWARNPLSPEPNYPRYDALRKPLWTCVNSLRNAIGDDFPPIVVVNMTYVNFIHTEAPSSVVTDYFSESVRLKQMDSALEVRKLEGAWSQPGGSDVRFALEQAIANLPDGPKKGYRLTTGAGLNLEPSADPSSGLNKIHDELQDFFVKLLSDRAKTEWQLQGGV